jgi:endonuclease YncB( thermonuclease family)
LIKNKTGKWGTDTPMNHLSAMLLRPAIALCAAMALPLVAAPAATAADHGDREHAAFGLCEGPGRITCVVDGDTFWYRGVKIRIADINAPEVSHPGCEREARLGAAATQRLTMLLNAGPFSLMSGTRETDRYGRALRVVVRRGESLGTVLESEGLAEHWKGRRSDWCAT